MSKACAILLFCIVSIHGVISGQTATLPVDTIQIGNQGQELLIDTEGSSIHTTRAFDSLIQELTVYKNSNSKKSKEFRDRGRNHARSGEYELAVTDFTMAIKLNRRDPNLYKNRANAYKNLGQHDREEADYSVAIYLKIDDLKVYLNRGHARLKLGKHDEAISDFTFYIDEENPNSAKNLISAFRGRANAHKHLSQFFQAILNYSEVIDRNRKLGQKEARAFTNRGAMYLKNHEYDKAIDDLTIALEMDETKEFEAYKYRAKAYEALGKGDLQEKDMAKYRKMKDLDSK